MAYRERLSGIPRSQAAQLFRLAAKLHRKRGEIDKADQLLKSARLLEGRPGKKEA